MIYIGVFVALLIFIYFNRFLRRRQEERRELWRERKEEQLERMLQNIRNKNSSGQNDEVSDTTEGK